MLAIATTKPMLIENEKRRLTTATGENRVGCLPAGIPVCSLSGVNELNLAVVMEHERDFYG